MTKMGLTFFFIESLTFYEKESSHLLKALVYHFPNYFYEKICFHHNDCFR